VAKAAVSVAIVAAAATSPPPPPSPPPFCVQLESMVSLRELSPPEWCNTDPARRLSAEACEAAFVDWEAQDGTRAYAACQYDAAAGQCISVDEEAVTCTDPGFCEQRGSMVNLRELSPPEWCNGHPARRESAEACEAAFVEWEAEDGTTVHAPCEYDAAAGQCEIGDGQPC